MQSNYKYVFWILGVVLCITVGYFSFEAYQYQYSYYELKTEYTSLLSWEDRLLNVNAWLFEGSNWGVLDVVSTDKLEKLNELQLNANQSLYWALSLGFIGCLVFVLVYRKKWLTERTYTILILSVASIFLVFGILTPMMEMEVYKDDFAIDIELQQVKDDMAPLARKGLELAWPGSKDFLSDRTHVFEGRMYFFYQSKSIFDLVGLLWKQGNIPIAIALALFSVVVPLIKIFSTLFLVFSKNGPQYEKMKRFVGFIGKWSMADVFVIAIYIAYISFYNLNFGLDTVSTALVGLYLFMSYVVLSIISYFIASKHLKLHYNGEKSTDQLAQEIVGRSQQRQSD